ncbi:phosphopantetheine-binding protein [Micromonospora echinaurantiaca]|uniref:Acyl carrier protein n=1 Tax=Micromonospora echinaurantiaca TaxID=47857 RepID=A0A1C5HKZ0_9ACTN|nr:MULTISPECIES: acyl carrier protein [Micromonospora]MDO3702950.1 acyl carrier protein [Micromonospora sp. C28SCA-DRY-2]SCG46684.1 acyl carrier protein [Micromonospora echinaurantiaca]
MPTRTESEVRTQLRDIILDLAPNPQPEVTDEALLVEDLEYHSLALLELAFALEDEFDLPPIDEENARNIRSIKDIEDYVLRQMDAKNGNPSAA